MMGMDAATGRALDDLGHIRQSVRDILTTPVGSRVMRRDYGSIVPELIDQPGNAVNRLRLQAATVGAIARWEPRIRITRLAFDYDADGAAVVAMEAVRVDGPRAGTPVSLTVGAA
ncbi:MAG: GPW/gp25 family protein [Pseudomonadota bacterium]